MKIKILLTSVIMAATLAVTGCGDKQENQNPSGNVESTENAQNTETKDAYTLYTDANKVINDAEAIEMKADIDMKISAEGQEVAAAKTSSTVKKVKKDDNGFDMELTVSTDSMGTPVEIHGFYTDGYLYAEVMGQKVKQPLSLEEALEQAKTKGFDFPKEAVKESKVTDLGDGQNQLDITLDPEATKSIMSEYLAEAGGAGFTEDSLTIKEVSISSKLDKDNNFVTNSIKFKGSLTMNEQTADLDMDMNTEVIKIGSDVTVELPQDLDTYIEAPTQPVQ